MSRKSGAAAIALLLAGCTVGPDYRPPAPASLGIPENYAPPVTATRTATGMSAEAEAADLATWWERFDDPLLTDLIGRATAGNLRIAQSLARLAEARRRRRAIVRPDRAAGEQQGSAYPNPDSSIHGGAHRSG